MSRVLYLVSDGTGVTVTTLANALLTQFPAQELRREIRSFVNTRDKAGAVAAEIALTAGEEGRPIVIASLLDPALRDIVAAAPCLFLDVVGTFMASLEREFGKPATRQVGRAHGVGDELKYTRRVEAVNYSLAADDGQSPGRYDRADVILTGVSRSGKTPTCLYLAMQHGLFCANDPLAGDDLAGTGLPARLARHREKLIGLTLSPARLHQIRRERRAEGEYSRPERCEQEVQAAETLFRKEGIPVIDVTTLSVEEIAATILARRRG
jgi:regulator of PEP synthase PpsR (kinase-PPPase family)